MDWPTCSTEFDTQWGLKKCSFFLYWETNLQSFGAWDDAPTNQAAQPELYFYCDESIVRKTLDKCQEPWVLVLVFH